ncbi:1-aminocyclopropane-1-carboxylate deaminase/D-cysteine desulfhydrase [Bergeyella sp. RCAD1439]|uniref:1-aminocyclopropane-1-carboxylate deaminase/D-cysteine desulfhydrase n=1 Tax=Bergeyella anatis TaxID=3113737 RepID=UPI002E19B92B|nr:pyridoxal-phosphate dependent enzyme [Bergeyella sp. RCAD1439]
MISELALPAVDCPLVEIPSRLGVRLFVKRADKVHPEISGNKYWKLFYNVNHYLERRPERPMLITFGGAYSNHIAAVSALAREGGFSSLGIIRGHELEYRWRENPTLGYAAGNGMEFRFVRREEYRDKEGLMVQLASDYPEALILPEGGTNAEAVEGIERMLSPDTQRFDYLCTAVGTGGTVAGLAKFAQEHQRVIGFPVVKDDSLQGKIRALSGGKEVALFEASFGGYGKLSDAVVRFINEFGMDFGIQLEAVYTGKMMLALFKLIEKGYFPKGSKILAFHTGGLQGIAGANAFLQKRGRPTIALVES